MSFEKRLDDIVKRTPLVDTHNDFPYLLRTQLHNELSTKGFDFTSSLTSHTDLNKLKKGKVGVQFFLCYLEPPEEDFLYQDFNLKNTQVRDTLEQIDVTARLVEANTRHLAFVTSSKAALEAYHHDKKIAVALGVEGLHQVDTSLGVLRQYYRLGVRYITLTHNCDNPFATAASSVAHGLPDKGLSAHGERCVAEMNRLGMMVDLLHVSYQTMLDALRITKAPVIFSHLSAYSLRNHPRNVPDDVLELLRSNDGVVQVNFYPHFLADTSKRAATIDDAVDHIFHIAKVAGWRHVGLGSDFDGMDSVTEGLEDASKYPDLIYKCMKKGATDDQIEGLIGGNLLRVWKRTEDVAIMLQKAHVPVNEKEWVERRWLMPESVQDLPEVFPGSRSLHKATNEYRDEYFSQDKTDHAA